MKANDPNVRNTPFSVRNGERQQGRKAPPAAAKSVVNPEAETLAKFYRKPAEGTMLLKNEGGLAERNPPWELVEKIIRELDPGRSNSHACLSIPGNNYIQCLHGFNGYHLEWRITNLSGSHVHYRACYPGGSKKSFELKKHDFVSDGQHRDLLNLEDVVDAFRSFHQRQGLPGFLKWRELDL